MSVNEKIRSIREAKGLTQEQVAEKTGISSSVYGDIERGENDPKLSKLQKIAEAFEIKLSELVDLSEKGTLNINFANYQRNGKNPKSKVYISSANSELEKQQLIIELKDKELAMKDREIENMKKQISQLEEINTLLKKEV